MEKVSGKCFKITNIFIKWHYFVHSSLYVQYQWITGACARICIQYPRWYLPHTVLRRYLWVTLWLSNQPLTPGACFYTFIELWFIWLFSRANAFDLNKYSVFLEQGLQQAANFLDLKKANVPKVIPGPFSLGSYHIRHSEPNPATVTSFLTFYHISLLNTLYIEMIYLF